MSLSLFIAYCPRQYISTRVRLLESGISVATANGLASNELSEATSWYRQAREWNTQLSGEQEKLGNISCESCELKGFCPLKRNLYL